MNFLTRLPLLLLVPLLLWAEGVAGRPWVMSLHHIHGTGFPSHLQITTDNRGMILLPEGSGNPMIGQWQGWQPLDAGFRASGLVFRVELGDLPPTETRLRTLSLERDPQKLAWQLTIGSIDMGYPHYQLELSDLIRQWDDRGNWQGSIGTIQLLVPLQIPVPYTGETGWRMLELAGSGFVLQGNPAGWKGGTGLIEGTVPVITQGTGNSQPTHYGQGRVEPLQMIVAADGRFSVSNPGGFVDRNLASWLLGRDYGKDIRIGPLNIEAIGNSRGIRLRTRNLLPWLDLWFGEPGAAARHLGVHLVGEDAVILLEKRKG